MFFSVRRKVPVHAPKSPNSRRWRSRMYSSLNTSRLRRRCNHRRPASILTCSSSLSSPRVVTYLNFSPSSSSGSGRVAPSGSSPRPIIRPPRNRKAGCAADLTPSFRPGLRSGCLPGLAFPAPYACWHVRRSCRLYSAPARAAILNGTLRWHNGVDELAPHGLGQRMETTIPQMMHRLTGTVYGAPEGRVELGL